MVGSAYITIENARSRSIFYSIDIKKNKKITFIYFNFFIFPNFQYITEICMLQNIKEFFLYISFVFGVPNKYNICIVDHLSFSTTESKLVL